MCVSFVLACSGLRVEILHEHSSGSFVALEFRVLLVVEDSRAKMPVNNRASYVLTGPTESLESATAAAFWDGLVVASFASLEVATKPLACVSLGPNLKPPGGTFGMPPSGFFSDAGLSACASTAVVVVVVVADLSDVLVIFDSAGFCSAGVDPLAVSVLLSIDDFAVSVPF